MRGPALIEKYIHSGLTPDERFELEKLALDDDFLAEAWEGVLSSDQAKDKEILASLKARINQRAQSTVDQKEAKVIPMYRQPWVYAVAASFTLLMLATFALRDQAVSPEMDAQVVAMDAPQVALEEETNAPQDMSAGGQAELRTDAKETNPPPQHEEDAPSSPMTTLQKTTSTKETAQKEWSATSAYLEEDRGQTTNEALTAQVVVDKNTTESSNEIKAPELVIHASDPNRAPVDLPASEPMASTEVKVLQVEEADLQLRTSDDAKESTKAHISARAAKTTGTVSAKSRKSLDEVRVKQLDEVSGFTPNRTMIDTTAARPFLGWDHLEDEITEHWDISEEDLFMIGIKEGEIIDITFDLSEGTLGVPINVQSALRPDMNQSIEEILQRCGRWTNPSGQRISYKLRVR